MAYSRTQLRPAVQLVLAAALPQLSVEVDDRSGDLAKRLEAAVVADGAVILVTPFLRTVATSSPGRRRLDERATLQAIVRKNPTASAIDLEATVSAVISALLASDLGAEFTADECVTFDPDDAGFFTYRITFTVPLTTS